jgi:DNA replication protein DnaC
LNSRIRNASFPVEKGLEDYNFQAVPGLNKQTILELARGEWISKHFNICFVGQPGTGKTHVSIGLGLAACRAGYKTKFVTAAGLVNRLEEAHKHYTLDRLLNQLDKLDLLIVDELGYLSFSRAGAELLFQVFADRYERKSLMITSNLAFSDWGQIFQGERMTAALLDRLTHHCHIFEMNGESYRFKESMKEKHPSGSKKLKDRYAAQWTPVFPSQTAPKTKLIPHTRWVPCPRRSGSQLHADLHFRPVGNIFPSWDSNVRRNNDEPSSTKAISETSVRSRTHDSSPAGVDCFRLPKIVSLECT